MDRVGTPTKDELVDSLPDLIERASDAPEQFGRWHTHKIVVSWSSGPRRAVERTRDVLGHSVQWVGAIVTPEGIIWVRERPSGDDKHAVYRSHEPSEVDYQTLREVCASLQSAIEAAAPR